MLLNQAAAMVDGVYQDIVEALKPGVRENEIVALANKRLYEMGSDQVEAINAISGERCNPHPHNFSDRIIRPGDQAFFDIIHSFNGYRTCYYRTFAVGSATASQRDAYTKAREWMDAAIEVIKPGVGTDEVAAVLAEGDRSSASPDEMAAFGLQFGHGLGLGLHERPIISRLNSMDEPDRAAGRAWSSRWRPTARPPTASRPRGSRRRSWSPRTARRCSPCSRRRTSSSPTSTERARRGDRAAVRGHPVSRTQ